ncbi:DUF2163 domain-containing protein [Citrobacter portucalensis]|jgi:hypothetical protein|uniref:DUF2163 domain-containing protein n=1 Tax=Escherichia coli TaxID=562 RepID=A0A9Q7KD31_ECOLX|nr:MULTISPECIES: DUF2163 domain-containing protein [Enterobacteriaceae]DAM24063.1 MAG TPA: minor tail component [Bacteriophage sp.]EFJ99653.1 hypothetical protein HMPREF9540_00231 [Escherichia coli MS 115-1]KAA0557752.1 DUF2163 domain-containing protein [Citrobacter werkmanii]MCV8437070.1 DUF2163 domain-containing protein [Escherichia coli]MDE9573319.1 DUF2163 domain-containing protein [Citrobacter portucalensis]
MSVKDQFNRLRKDPDFIEAYNDFNGTNYTELTTGQLFSVGTLFHLVQIKMHNGTELLLTDAYYDLQYQGKNYIAAGDFTDISSISEEKEINNIGMTVKLANIRKEYINLIRTKALNRADVKIDICFLNPNTGSPTESFNLFTGSMDKLTVNIEYDDNEAKNETEAVMNSIWEVLEKSARNHASDGVHRSYPGNEQDTFFSRIGKWNSESKWTSVK